VKDLDLYGETQQVHSGNAAVERVPDRRGEGETSPTKIRNNKVQLAQDC